MAYIDTKGRKHYLFGPISDNEYWIHGNRMYTRKQFIEALTPEEKEEVFLRLLIDPDMIKDYEMDDWEEIDIFEYYFDIDYNCMYALEELHYDPFAR